jgi:6-phosphogluconolactonase (cycloisomerase 2 family)
MKSKLKAAIWILSLSLFFSACQKEKNQFTEEKSPENVNSEESNNNEEIARSGPGHVYTLTNASSGNSVLIYDRASNGQLTYSGSCASGGNGTGTGLGNQGAVILANEDEVLLAINAGSNSISSFNINNNGLSLKSTVSSGGMMPVSITQHEDIVYVLNAGGTNNISGFKLKQNGRLEPISNSTRPLSAASTGPAQISFIKDGRVLVITEKGTNKIVSYTVNEYGIPGMMHTITSSNPTPFGFAKKNGNIFVSEAVGGAPGASVLSSYNIRNNGEIDLINGSVGAGQSAACWVVITNNGKFAYTTNTASDNITTFGITNMGGISVSQAISATTEAGPIDADLSNNSKYLYILNGAGKSIQAYNVNNNGSLSFIQTVTGLPMGANGLAAK